MTAVTAILNVHREGALAHSSLLSIAAARHTAEAAGLEIQVVAVADCADAATLDVLRAADGVEVLEVGVDDLGLARNAGVRHARGRYIAFLDGDDLWGPNWLLAAHQAAEAEPRPAIWHPAANLFFGPGRDYRWTLHPDIETAEGDWVTLGIRNQWTSLGFGPAGTYRAIPYRATDLAGGFGYEDWSWNSETVAQGLLHKPVPGTVHLIRTRPNSLLSRTGGAGAWMTPSSLLRSRIGWAARVGQAGVAADHPAIRDRQAVV